MRKFILILFFAVFSFPVFSMENDIFCGFSLALDIADDKEINSYIFPLKPEIYAAYNVYNDGRLLGFHGDFTCKGIWSDDEDEPSQNVAMGLLLAPSVKLRTPGLNLYFSPGFSCGFSTGLVEFKYSEIRKKEFNQFYLGFGGEVLFSILRAEPFAFGVRGFYYPFCYSDVTLENKYKQKTEKEFYSSKSTFSIFIAFSI